jgi:hypothetical protein
VVIYLPRSEAPRATRLAILAMPRIQPSDPEKLGIAPSFLQTCK